MLLPFFLRAASAFIIALALALPAAAQPGLQNVPTAVRAAFAQRFGPPAPKPTWERKRGNIWQAMFRLPDGVAASARFNRQGGWLETTRVMAVKNVPAGARAYVLTHFPNRNMRSAAHITYADQSQVWRVSVDGQRLFFDSTGHYLRTAPARGVATATPKARRKSPTAPILADPAPGAAVVPGADVR